MEDAQIIELYFARQERAITETDRKYGKLCLHIANHILSDGRDSAECVNDAYLCVWNEIPPTRPGNFRAFLSKIVRNLSLKKLEFLHAKKRNANIELSFSELEEVVPDHRIRPDYNEEELGELLSAFLKKEKDISRNVFIRKYYFFDSVKEIAERYSFTESKVKSMLYHTRNKLRKYLEKE